MVEINVADVGSVRMPFSCSVVDNKGSVTSLVSCSVVDNEIIEDGEGGGAPVVGFTVITVDDIIV